MSEQQNNAPLQFLRDGALVVKLWRQESEKGPFVTATLGRTYKDQATGEFKESRSLGETDMLKAQALLREARKEAQQWKSYFKEIEQPNQKMEKEAQQPAPEHAAAQPEPSLAEQRDAALAQAAPDQSGLEPDQSRDHTTRSNPER